MSLFLASAGDDVKLWEGSDFILSRQLNPHDQNVSTVSWANDNSFLASLSVHTEDVAITNMKSYEFSTVPCGAGCMCIDINEHSRYMLTAGTDTIISVWDLKSKKVRKKYKGHKGPVTCARFNAGTSSIASGSESGEIILHNVVTAQACRPLVAPNIQAVKQVQFSRHKKSMLGSVSDDGSVNLWDCNAQRLMHGFSNHRAPATSLSFSPINDMFLISVGLDKRIACYDVQAKKAVKIMSADSPLTSLDTNSDGVTVVVGSTRGKIYHYDLRMGSVPVQSIDAHKSSVQCLRFQLEADLINSSKTSIAGSVKQSKPRQLPVSPKSNNAIKETLKKKRLFSQLKAFELDIKWALKECISNDTEENVVKDASGKAVESHDETEISGEMDDDTDDTEEENVVKDASGKAGESHDETEISGEMDDDTDDTEEENVVKDASGKDCESHDETDDTEEDLDYHQHEDQAESDEYVDDSDDVGGIERRPPVTGVNEDVFSPLREGFQSAEEMETTTSTGSFINITMNNGNNSTDPYSGGVFSPLNDNNIGRGSSGIAMSPLALSGYGSAEHTSYGSNNSAPMDYNRIQNKRSYGPEVKITHPSTEDSFLLNEGLMNGDSSSHLMREQHGTTSPRQHSQLSALQETSLSQVGQKHVEFVSDQEEHMYNGSTDSSPELTRSKSSSSQQEIGMSASPMLPGSFSVQHGSGSCAGGENSFGLRGGPVTPDGVNPQSFVGNNNACDTQTVSKSNKQQGSPHSSSAQWSGDLGQIAQIVRTVVQEELGTMKKDIRSIVREEIDDLMYQVHNDIINLQAQMLVQFEIQNTEMLTLFQQYSVNQELVSEIERLQEEVKRLKKHF